MKKFNLKLQAHFEQMCKTGKLFRVALTGAQVWDLYLKSFKVDPVFRDPASTEHNCNNCNNFVRRYGNIVAIGKNYEIITLFDFAAEDEYTPVALAMSEAIKKSVVQDVFFETFQELNSLPYESCTKKNDKFKLGIDKNVKRYTKEEAEKFGVVKPEEIKQFDHMHMYVPSDFVDMTGKSVESIQSAYRDAKEVFKRGMDTIALDTLLLVKDLINQGSLLDGATHLPKIEKIIPLKEAYDKIPADQRDNWCWVTSNKLPIAKFRNELIGTLCSELSEGEDLNKACQSWNKRVDPVNYMKTTAPITKKQIEEAKKFVEDNGFVESFDRRFATIADIQASEILHVNAGKGEIKEVSIFDGVKSTSTRHKRSEFVGVEEVTIEKFMKDIIPSCTAVEVFLTNQQERNMVSMTTANIPTSKPIFKWSNNYSWTYNGNLAGKSQIKEAVKNEGGKVDGVLRFSIIWNEDGKDILDFDAHAIEPGGGEIAYNTYKSPRQSPMLGQLDVDMISPSKMGVENITWPDLSRMKDGTYTMFIRNFNGGRNNGFRAEIEFNGEIYSYQKTGNIQQDVQIAEVTLKKGEFSIKHLLPENGGFTNKEIYELETNQFHKVNLICLSPNHWNGESIGNKHYFMMLQDCKSPTELRSFHNENLSSELESHKRVLEVLGTTAMIKSTKGQLSGLGFNATVRDEVILRLSGTHKRVVKVKF